MHTFLVILAIIGIVLLIIGLIRWMMSDDLGFFTAIFFFDVFEDLADCIGDLISSIGDD